MSVLALIISLFVFGIILIAIFWIGIYVVLPIVLFFTLVSAIVSLISGFVPEKKEKIHTIHHQKNEGNQIIDVEYEEIKN